MQQANFGYIVRKRSCYDHDGRAIVEQATGNEYSYGDLERRSNRVARALADRGVGPGDRVCGLFRNSIEFFDVFFAACKLGAVIAPFNYRLAVGELDFLLSDCEPALFVYDGVFEAKVAGLHLEGVDAVRIGPPDDGERLEAEPYGALLDHDPGSVPVATGFEDPAVLLYTSGSTGRPKGVPISHRNLFFSSVNYIIETELNRGDVTLTSSPLFHVGGLNIFTLQILHVGGTVVLQQAFDPAETWEILAEHAVTKFFAIPTMLNSMINVPDWQSHDLSALDLVVSGGEPVPTELKEAFQEVDVVCTLAYGLTETTDGTLYLRPEHAMDKSSKCNGKTFPHVDAKVVDRNGDEVPPGVPGELLHRGPTVADGYLGLPAETEETWDGEWFHTGDIAEVDDEGFYYIHGRMDDMIISGGENIYPGEVEDVLYSHPAIEETVVFGTPDETWGEIVVAVVVPTEPDALSRDDIRSFLAADLARFKHPKEIVFTDELPKSGTEKIDRQSTIERYESG